jgi:hypothetical protein
MKKKAKEIIKNLTETINRMENKQGTVQYLQRTDMFSAPTASKEQLEKKKKELIIKYNLKSC